MGVLALIFAVRAFLAWLVVRRDARDDYDYKRSNGMVPDAISRENYERIYRKVYNPRGPIHIAGAMIAILLVTPIAMKVFEVVFDLIYHLSGQSRVIEPGYLVWHFFLFFSMIAVWVGVAYLAARQYHKAAPGNLQFELNQYLYGPDDTLDQHVYDGEDRSPKSYLVLALIISVLTIAAYALRQF